LHANQIVDAASSIAANLEEGNRRTGRDRLHLFRIAAGSAAETRVHLQVAQAWGWVSPQEIQLALSLVDRELRLLHGLTR
jgi:four helix bundle protein